MFLKESMPENRTILSKITLFKPKKPHTIALFVPTLTGKQVVVVCMEEIQENLILLPENILEAKFEIRVDICVDV